MNLDDLIKPNKVGTLHLWAVQLSFAVTEMYQPNRNDQELLWGVKEEIMWAAACILSHQHMTLLQMHFIWLLQGTVVIGIRWEEQQSGTTSCAETREL